MFLLFLLCDKLARGCWKMRKIAEEKSAKIIIYPHYVPLLLPPPLQQRSPPSLLSLRFHRLSPLSLLSLRFHRLSSHLCRSLLLLVGSCPSFSYKIRIF
jgi:hypothetical protein